MSPGGGVSVPAGAAPAWDDAAVAGAAPVGDEAAADDEAPVDDAACGAGVPAGPLQALAHRPAAARTASRLITVLALLMGRML